MFSVEFVGEGSIDAGGPFRECMTNLKNFSMKKLPLMILKVLMHSLAKF